MKVSVSLRNQRQGLVKFLAGVLAFVVLYGCADVRAESRLRVEFWQDADSARFVISWNPRSVDNRRRPIAYWDVRIVNTVILLANDTLAQDTTDWLSDTLAVAYPALDSSLIVKAIVRGISTSGLIGDWNESSPLTFTNVELPPFPPDSVRIDSTLAVVRTQVRPRVVSVVEGNQRRLCSMLTLSNGSTEFGDSGSPQANDFCRLVYERWLLERRA